MKTVLLGPQRFRTTVGAAIRTVAPEGTIATVTAGWRDRESDTDELDATLEGRGRHLHLYGRLTDVLDSDQRFAEAALAHRDAVDELAGIYSLRLQRALDSVYTVLPKFNNCPILQSDPDGLSGKVSVVVVDK